MTEITKHQLDDPQAMEWACELFACGVEEGGIPADREPPHYCNTAFFAWEGDRVIGGVTLFLLSETNRTWVDILYVRPESRRKGLALALLEKCREHTVQIGADALELGTLLTNEPMEAVLSKAGYLATAVIYRLPASGADHV